MIKKLCIALLSTLLPLSVMASQITVPSAPSSGYFLVSTTTGNYVASSTPSFLNGIYFSNATGTSATTTNFFATTASSSNLFTALFNGAGLSNCTGSNFLQWSGGLFSCGTPAGGGSGAYPFQGANNSTSTLTGFTGGLYANASSTLNNFTFNTATGTSATTTNFFSTTASTSQLYIGAGTGCASLVNGLFTVTGSPCTSGTVTSVTGTANRITSTGGATPQIDISGSYVGQSSITTVGTLSSGAVPASLVTSGTFGSGNYIFPAFLTVLGSTTLQNFTASNATTSQATTTNLFATNASTTNLTGKNINGFNLSTCTNTNALTWSSGIFGCVAIPQGTVTSVTGTWPITSSGGATPAISWSGLASSTNLVSSNLFYSTGANTYGQVATGTISGASVISVPAGMYSVGSGGAITTTGGTFGSGNYIFPAQLQINSSTTLQNFTGLNSTTTNATTTSIIATTASTSKLFLATGSQNCLGTDTTGLVIAGTCTGGGSGGGTWATTTSTVTGELNNYSLNTTDIVDIGGSATTSAKFWFDPNQISANFGTGSTNISLSGAGYSYITNPLGIGTTTPMWQLDVASSTAPQLTLTDPSTSAIHWSFRNAGGNLYFATSSPTTFATSSKSAVLIDKNGFLTLNADAGVGCGQFDANGLLTNTGTACGSGTGGSGYPFQLTGNATSTLTQFNGGLTAYGSTTIGAGTQVTGLTVSGGATTTATTTLAWTMTNPRVDIGAPQPIYGYLVNDRLNIEGNLNDYSAANIYNTNAGTCATADWTVANDLNSTALNFGDFGHTSSKFTGSACTNNPFTAFQANSTYIFDPSGYMNFALATTSVGRFQWFTGGYAASNIQMNLDTNGRLGLGSTTPYAEMSLGAPAGTAPLFAIGSTTSVGGSGLVASISYQPYSQMSAGTTSPDAEFAFEASTTAAAQFPYILDIASSTSGTAVTSVLKITQGGSMFAPNTLTQSGAATDYWCYDASGQFIRVSNTCTVSAAKFKKDVTALDPSQGLQAVLAMKPVNYYLNALGIADPNNPDETRQQIGFIADDNTTTVPLLILHDNTGAIHGFNYEQYTANLTLAIQQLNAKVDSMGSGATRSMEENWQWIAIGLLALWNVYLTCKKK